jgi:membrane-bound lytic murein transglycosylase C
MKSPMNRRRLLASLPVAALGFGAGRPVLADMFDSSQSMDSFDSQIDKEFEAFDQEMDARFARMDQAITEGFQEMEQDLRQTWGQATKLPSRKTWVGYTRDRRERVIVDYEAGTVTVERQGTTDKQALSDSLSRTLSASSRDLDQQDVVGQHVAKKAQNAAQEAVSKEGRSKNDASNELGRLVDPKAEPSYTRETVTGSDGQPREVGRVTVKMLPEHETLSAKRIAPVVRRYAESYGVSPSLILAVTKNESSFNPRAQSHVPAFGLMQLVPSSGGRDAFKLVAGADRAPSPDYLFQPNQNIELGTAYLHILTQRYLAAIDDPVSREYCAIAAYNTGAGNVARTFVGTTSVSAAARRINRMSAQTVYSRLKRGLPYEETRVYLARVVRDRETYRGFDAG